MIDQKNNFLWYKLNGGLRYLLLHSCTRYFPFYVVNEYPKSGGSWVASMLSDALEVPFPRNRLPMLQSSILHGHFMQSWNVSNLLIMWRDGRDVLVSQYYHYLFYNDRGNSDLVNKCRNDLRFDNYEDIRSNLPAFMDYVYRDKKHPRMSWSDFVGRWAGCDWCTHVKYEDLRMNPEQELARVVFELSGKQLDDAVIEKIVDDHSFMKQSGRQTGEQDIGSFLRKGIVGDWKNHFSEISMRKFDKYSGGSLIMLGYEESSDWVRE